jgi:transcriptional regulator with XRE-family HTH domain
MLLRNVIGAALRRIRQDEGRTLREVALTANISMPYLSEIERGRKEPSSEILAGICAALGLTMLDLLHEASVEGRSAEALVVDLTAPIAPVTAITSAHERVEARAPAQTAPRRGDEIALAVAA